MSGPSEYRTPGGEGPGRLQVVDRHGPQKRRPISVLCVEDDADDAHLMGRHLAALDGFAAEVGYASSLSVARAMLDRHRFDVVICDFWLGDSTSIPLIDQIRMEARACPVVLVSSLENDDIELIGRRAGAAGYVAKADLSASALERVFVTLLAAEDARPAALPGAGVGPWLRALLRSLDRVHAASTLALASGTDDTAAAAQGFLSDIVANSSEIRSDVIDKLAGLERATRRSGSPVRFDVVPFLADAARLLKERAADEEAVSFLVPAMPLLVESSPSLFSDLMQGFFAQALDAVGRGDAVTVAPSIEDGCFRLDLSIRDRGRCDNPGDERVLAAADTRRFLVETLAKATGGSFDEAAAAGGRAARLSVPLRAPLL